MFIQDVQFSNGTILAGEKIRELIEGITNKFSEEGLSCEEAKFVLEATKNRIEGNSFVRPISYGEDEDEGKDQIIF